MIDQSIYIREGYLSRKDYLVSLADDFGIDETIVFALASMLGSNEDFDGLVTELEDMVDMGLEDWDLEE